MAHRPLLLPVFFFALASSGLAQTDPPPIQRPVVEVLGSESTDVQSRAIRIVRGATTMQMKLQIATKRVDVVGVERSDSNWWGTVKVKVEVPCDVTYTIDLEKLREQDVTWDSSRQRVVVRMPEVKIEAVAPTLGEMRSEVVCTRLRFRAVNQGVTDNLRQSALEDVPVRARAVAEEDRGLVETAAREKMRDFLRKMLKDKAPEVEFEIR